MATVWKRVRSWLSGGAVRGFDVAPAERVRAAADRFDRISDLVPRARELRDLDPPDSSRALVDGLALFSVVSARSLGLSPFVVQLQAAAEIALGAAVEMQTGEGKSLTAALAAAALSLQGRHVHVVTVNRYLAERDFRRFKPAFEALGLTVGLVVEGRSSAEKSRAYRCDVVYGTGYEFGFDYLREQLRRLRCNAQSLSSRLQGSKHGALQGPAVSQRRDVAIVDELDSVLLDEACVPLILSEASSGVGETPAAYAAACEVADRLEPGTHYGVHPLHRTIVMTPAGLARCDAALPRNQSVKLIRPWRTYVQNALVASTLFRRDVDYIVADGRIWLVDSATGRIFGDRRWPEGLHQAVEFREGVSFSPPTVGAARITRQRYFSLYRTLSGMSGTLSEAADELRQTYRLDVRSIAPRLPSRRVEWPARYFADDRTRLDAVAREAAEQHVLGRPILVGCRTIQASHDCAAHFTAAGLPAQLLNGVQTEEEADLIAVAGRAGMITIATNLAGRGTDIMLDDAARRAGGLHVQGIERHDSPRIDRQLVGRAGRQGDPGSGRFFLSADDAIFAPFREAQTRVRRLAAEHSSLSTQSELNAEVRRCQSALEDQARGRRRETSAVDDRLEDLLSLLARPE